MAMLKRLSFPQLIALTAFLVSATAWSQEAPPTVIPPPALDTASAAHGQEKAVLAGGCYWGTQ
jgi:peptide-methionine (S)-S-oxide reductase